MAANGHVAEPKATRSLKASTVHLVAIDPVDVAYSALLLPFCIKRVYDMAAEFPAVVQQTTKIVLGRVIAGDPLCKLLAMVKGGRVVGHALYHMHADGDRPLVWILQCAVDGDGGDAVQRTLETVTAFGKEHGATTVEMATARNPKAWEKSYGFRVKHTVMDKPIED